MRWLALPMVALLAGCGSQSTPLPATTLPPPSPKVVVISIDGLRPDALAVTPAPRIRGLADRGAYSWSAETVFPSNTLPAHVSMLSGYDPSVHRIAWDEYLPQRGRITVPTIFTAVRAAGLRGVMVVGKEKLNHFRDTGSVDTYILATGGDDDVANQAIVQAATPFDLMFVHLPNVDVIGHARGWMSPSYLAQVTYTDSVVDRLVAALPSQTTLILTADHGGHDFGHGTRDPRDMTIPWIIAGPAVRPHVLSSRIVTTDTAATAAYVLGLRLPVDATGRVIAEAFTQTANARGPVRQALDVP